MKVLRCDPPPGRSGAAGDFVDYRTALDADIVGFHVPYLREGEEATSTCWEPRRSPSVRPGRSSSTPPAARCGTTMPCLSASRDPIPAAGDGRMGRRAEPSMNWCPIPSWPPRTSPVTAWRQGPWHLDAL